MPPVQIDNTAESIISSAKALFWEFGIRKVTVAEICQAAEVSKMTFYRKFKNKMEVARAVLDRLIDSGRKNYAEVMARDVSFPEKIAELIQIKHRESQGISLNFINDLLQGDFPELQDQLTSYQQEAMGNILNDMVTAQQEGWIRKELKPEFILFMFADTQQKMTNTQLQALYEDPVELIMELTNFLFYGMADPNRPDA